MKDLTEDCNNCPIINNYHSSRILDWHKGDFLMFKILQISRYKLSHNLWKEMNLAMEDLPADKMVAIRHRIWIMPPLIANYSYHRRFHKIGFFWLSKIKWDTSWTYKKVSWSMRQMLAKMIRYLQFLQTKFPFLVIQTCKPTNGHRSIEIELPRKYS